MSFRPKTKILVFAHEGTRPHVIMPKRASRLAFQVAAGTGPLTPQMRFQGGGVPGAVAVFAKKVHHPGQPPRPLMPSPAVAKREISEGITEYLDKELRRLGG